MMKRIIIVIFSVLSMIFMGSISIIKQPIKETEEIEKEMVNLVDFYKENPDILEEKTRPEREARALAIVADIIAPDCDDTCKEAIMQCVINRVRTRGFPNSIEKVCYDKNQFYGATQNDKFTDETFRFAKEFLSKQGTVHIAKIPTNMVYLDKATYGIYFKTNINSGEETYVPYNSAL